MLWYLLIGIASWNETSFLVGMLLGIVGAGAATWVLIAKGDRGTGVGTGAMIGFAISFLALLGGCNQLLNG